MASDRKRHQRAADDEGIDARTLPHNLEAERSVLGAVMVQNPVLDILRPVLSPVDFYRDAHQRIWRALLELNDRGVVMDFITVKEELARAGDLDECGGPAYVAMLTDGVPRATNAIHYAGIVKEKSRLRGLIFAANKILTNAYAAEEPALDILHDADSTLLALQAGHTTDIPPTMEKAMPEVFADIERRVEVRGTLTGLETGYEKLNFLTFGWQRREFTIIGARPSIGKTTFGINTLVHAAAAGAKCLVFSLEMHRDDIRKRMLASASTVDLQRIRSGFLGGGDWGKIAHGLEKISRLHIRIDDRPGQTAASIRALCRRLKSEEGLDVVMLDYIQLVKPTPDMTKENRPTQIADISRRMKLLAGELDVSVLAVAQLSRASEQRADPRPKLSDLKESGALEQDADTVFFLHREDHRQGGLTEGIVAKQRNGPTGTVMLWMERDTTTFTQAPDDAAPVAQAALPEMATTPNKKRPRRYK